MAVPADDRIPRSAPERHVRSRAWPPYVAGAVLAGAWAWLYHPVLAWLAMIYPRDDFRVSALALAATVLLLAARRRPADRTWLAAGPSGRPLPLAVAFGCAGAYLLVERFLDVNILSAVLFGLSTYGLVGLWLPARAWRAGWPAVLLLIGTLPFGAHMQVFIGLPVRVATADFVARSLDAAGVAATSRDAILTLERSVARVDLPCSGVQSLWTGGLFFLATTWLDGRRLGVRWLCAALATAGLLLVGNAGRVMALVVVGEVLSAPAYARIAHAPLGVLAFAAACAAGVGLLRLVPRGCGALDDAQGVDNGANARDRGDAQRRHGGAGAATATGTERARAVSGGVGQGSGAPETASDGPHGRSATRRVLLLAGALGALALAYQPRPAAPPAPRLPDALWPSEMATTPEPLSPEERAWLARDGAERAERVRFAWPVDGTPLTGSATVIASATWRAQHLPERCLEVYGLRLTGIRSVPVARDFPMRVVTLGDRSRGEPTRTAVYWFQSATQLTDDYATRIAADLAPHKERWVLVALLFDAEADPALAAVAGLAQALRASIASSLAASPPGGSS